MAPLVCIFAHPDDEAFGPAGTIALQAKHRAVYLVCVTNGDAQQAYTTHKSESLGDIRKRELQASAQILGVKDVYFLNYHDGSLSNNLYHEIAEKIAEHLKIIQPDTVLTFEHKGISGHVDHIAVSLITTFVCMKLPFVSKVMYYAELKQVMAEMEDYFIYQPEGYDHEQIDLVSDVSEVWETKLAAMRAHKSQAEDAEMLLRIFTKFPKEEYFLIKLLHQ